MGALVAQCLPLEAPSRIKSISAICPIPACGSQIPDDAKEHLEYTNSRTERMLTKLPKCMFYILYRKN